MIENRNTRLAIILGALLLGGTTHAAINPERLYLAAQGQVPWHSLSDEEQDALQDYRGRWHNYDGDRQQRMREGARRFHQLPAEKRHKVEQKHHEYERLSPQEQHRLHKEYQRQHK